MKGILQAGRITTGLVLLGYLFLASMGADYSWAEIIPQDRRINWSPGIPGGILNRAVVFANVIQAPYIADNTGVNDASSAIQKAINDCPVSQVVYIPDGTYLLKSGLALTKGVILRGDGPKRTKLKFYGTSGEIAIRIGNYFGTTIETGVSGSPGKDASQITVSSAANFAVNDYIIIDQLNDSSTEVWNTNGESWLPREGQGTRCLGQMTKIAGKAGNILNTRPALYHSYSIALSPAIRKSASAVVEYAGIEDLYVELAGTGASEGIINLKNCAYCWVKNVETYNCSTCHVKLAYAFKCEIRDSYFHHGQSYGGGEGYGLRFDEHSTDCLAENNILNWTRHAMVCSGGPSGSVFGYNYSINTYYGDNPSWLAPDISTHGAHPNQILYEGNWVVKAHLDDTHGSASYNTLFRNYIVGDSGAYNILKGRRVIDVERRNYYHNILGNILGNPSVAWTGYEDNGTRDRSKNYIYNWGYASDGAATTFDSRSKASALRHGNYDHYTDTIQWNPGIADHNLPKSYYLLSKPVFFGVLPWPWIGPDLTPMVNTLPAKKRFDEMSRPTPSQNLKIIP